MKQFKLTFLVIALMMVLSNVGWGQAILYEDFNYTVPGYIGGNGAAGTTSNNWTTHSVTTGQTTTVDLNSGSLTYPGLPSSTGNKVYLFGNANATSRDINRAFTSSATVLYYSAIINIIDNTQITAAGDYFLHFGATSGTAVTLFGGRLGVKSVNTGSNFRFIIQNNSSGTPTFTEYATDMNFGTSYLIVVKYDRSASPTIASLWVNPSSLGGSEPSGSVSNNSGTAATFTSFASICLRNNATTPKAYIDEIRVGSTWADVTPTGSLSAPTVQATNINFTSILSSQMSVNWTNGDGAKRVVIMNTSNTFTAPTDGTDPSANPSWQNTGQQVVYNNNSNTVPVTNLLPNTTYWFRVYEYNGAGATTKYLTTTGTNNPNSQITPFAAPSTQASAITFPDVQQSQMTISWTNGNGSSRAVFVKELSGTITNPSNGTTYTASSDWNTKGTQLGTSGYFCVYNNNTGTSVTVTNLKPGTLYVVQIFDYNGTGTGTVYNVTTATGNPNSQTTLNNVPTISVNPSTLTGFSTNAGTVSTAQTYTLSGSSLEPPDENITVSAPANFEVSTDGTNYLSSTTVVYTGGVLSNTTIYIRIASTSSVGTVTGDVSNNGGNVSAAVNVNVSGFVFATQPTTQPNGISFTNVTTTTLDLNWTKGNGTNTIVLIKSGSAVNSNPVSGTSYTADPIFGSGAQIGTGNYVVYNGTGSTVSITGLNASTTYHVALYSFNGSGTNVNYLTTSPLIGNQLTSSPPANTYTWSGADGGDFGTAANWTPTRTTPATNDVLQFSDGTSKTIVGVTTQTIGQLLISGNTTVNLQSGSAQALTISGGTGTDLSIGAGSQLNFNSAFVLTLNVGTGATGSILGSITFTNAAHKLTAVDASGITFGNGGIFTAGTGFSSNAFGTTNLNSIIFANGSAYIQKAGSNPFGASQPNSVIIFQTGSLFRLDVSSSPAMIGRVYANFESNFTGTALSLTGATAVTLDNLIMTSGTINMNFTAGINIKGNISVNSGATLTFSPASANTINLNGTLGQTITNNGTLTFGLNSTINLSNSNGLTLGSDVNFNNLTMSSGNILTVNDTLTVNGTFTNTTPDATKMVIVDDGTNFGAFRRNITATGDYLYTIGQNRGTAYFTPVVVNFTAGQSATSYLTVSMKGNKDAGNTSSTDFLARTWTLTPVNITSPSYTVQLNYLDGDINGTENNIWFGKSNAGVWTLLSPIPDYNNNRFTSNAQTSFSTFTGGEQSAMPVNLSSLNSSVAGRNIKINWTTASENNNAGFNVERMLSAGTIWEKIGYVSGHGTVNTPTNYSFEDRNLQTGKYKYRLKQIDVNGNFEYFTLNGEVEIGVPKKFDLSQNYPNPFNPTTKINFDLPVDSKVTMLVYDITGREIARLVNNEFKKAGYYTTDFNAGMLSSGVYFYSLSTDAFRMTKKMVVLK